MQIRMKVIGIRPFSEFVIDARMMNMNTIPLAPSSALFGNAMLKMMPVTTAVSTIISRMSLLPYFSSRIGPSMRM